MTTPRLLCAKAALTRRVVYGWDITQAYIQSELKQGKTIHIFPPRELQAKDHRGIKVVLRVRKNLYGLPSAGHDHYTSVDDHMNSEQNMHGSLGDNNLFTGLDKDQELVACFVYVDDGMMLGSKTWRQNFMQRLKGRFIVDDMKPQKDTLNIQIEQSLLTPGSTWVNGVRTRNSQAKEVTVKLHQTTYIMRALTECVGTPFETLDNVPPRKTPMDKQILQSLDVRLPRKAMEALAKAQGKTVTFSDAEPTGQGHIGEGHEPDDLEGNEPTESIQIEEDDIPEAFEINDESPDPTQWSLRKMEDTINYQRVLMQLNYAARCTRLDISMQCGVLARHMIKPSITAYRGLIQVMRYLTHHLSLGLTYREHGNPKPVFYCDADYVRGRPRCGYVAMVAGAAWDWSSVLSLNVAIATAEAELYGALIGQKRGLTSKKDLEALQFVKEDEALDYREDNASTLLNLQRRVIDFSRMKHIENGFLKTIEWQARKRINWSKEGTKTMLADFFTKFKPAKEWVLQRNVLMGIRNVQERLGPPVSQHDESKSS